MLIYVVLVGLILFMGLLLRQNKITKKQFCLVVGAAFILVTGLRGPDVGSDTTVYYIDFKAMEYVSWQRLMEQERRDIVFYILSWVISRLTGNFVLLTMLVAIVFYCPVMKLIYKHSDSPALSCLILMAFNFFQFSMTGMRQTVAFGFVILFFLELHEKRCSWKKTALFIVCAILFHRSAIIALLYPLIKLLSKRADISRFMIALIPVVFLLRGFIVNLMSGVLEEMGFDLSESDAVGAGLTTFLLYCVLTVGAMLIKPDLNDGEISASEIFLFAVLGTSFQSFVMVNSVFFRVAWYFAMFFIILIPRFLQRGIFAKPEMKTLKVLAYGAILAMYFLITIGSAYVLPYQFFFQG
jgi:hypothetical protein